MQYFKCEFIFSGSLLSGSVARKDYLKSGSVNVAFFLRAVSEQRISYSKISVVCSVVERVIECLFFSYIVSPH